LTRSCADGPDETSEAFIRRRGFSDRYLENFYRPFFAGVFLERELQTSARALRFDLKMLAEGGIAIPARGNGAIAEQIAEELFAAGRIRLNTPAESLVDTDGRCTGVVTAHWRNHRRRPVRGRHPRTRGGAFDEPPDRQGGQRRDRFVLCRSRAGVRGQEDRAPRQPEPVRHQRHPDHQHCPRTRPAARHLLSVSVLGDHEDEDDTALFARGLADLRRMWAGDRAAQRALATYEPLAIYRIPFGQFAQPPGIYETLPGQRSRPAQPVLCRRVHGRQQFQRGHAQRRKGRRGREQRRPPLRAYLDSLLAWTLALSGRVAHQSL
jgi:hypothetical protein